MKKILVGLVSLCLLSLSVLADDVTEVKEAFQNYVNDANSYSTNLPNHYIKYAKIIRVVNKKQGGQREIIIPFDRYLKELKGNSTLAKAVQYKNRYTNIKVHRQGENYKLSATRIPRNDKKGLPCHFIYTKQDGVWKIKEESMTTNVQVFLTAR